MSNNPFNLIDERLSSIENLLHTLTDRQPKSSEANAPQSELLTIEQAAEFLHLSKATMYSKVSRKQIKFMKPSGKRLYFLRESLLEYVKAGRCETAQEMADNAHEYLTKKKGGQRNG